MASKNIKKGSIFQLVIKNSLYIPALAVLYALTGSRLFIYIAIALISMDGIVSILKKDDNRILGQILLLTPLIGIFKIDGAPFVNYYIIVALILKIALRSKINSNKAGIVFLLLYIFTDLFKYLVFNDSETIKIANIASVISLYSSLLFTYINKEEIKINKEYLSNHFIIGAISSIVYGLIIRYNAGGLVYAFTNTSILTRNAGASGDPNYFGLYIALSIAMLITRINSKNSIKTISLIIFMAICGLSSSSRMYYLLTILLLIYLSITIIKNTLKTITIKTIITSIFVIIASFGSIGIIANNAEYVLQRINSEKDISDGRFSLIEEYTTNINKNTGKLIFGIGTPKYNERLQINHYAHNIYLEVLITNGLVGIVVIGLIIINHSIHYRIKIISNKSLPLIILVVSGFFLSMIEHETFYILFLLCYTYLPITNKERNKCHNIRQVG